MRELQDFTESRLSQGKAYFSRHEAMAALDVKPKAFLAAAERLIRKQRIAPLKRGFYLVLRPEDRVRGAPDPGQWIDPLMRHLGVPYRISLLRAAAFHGSTHQAVMVFQVIAPKQIADLVIGRHRVQFVYQAPAAFRQVNRDAWLSHLRTDAGFATVAGVELTLLDCCRYFHYGAGISGVAQAVHDLGAKASGRILSDAAASYEKSAVRRLGYLLDSYGHERQAKLLLQYSSRAKSYAPLDPSAKAFESVVPMSQDKDPTWKVIVNVPLEIDR
jgi:predicted transcriptional regulator of viral defense system